MKNKTAQVTMWVIMGILIVGTIALFLYLKKQQEPVEGGKQELNQITVFESCLEEKAKELGFESKIYSLKLNGEAKNSLLPLMETAKNGEAILAGGETTVIMNNELGIKNYELGKGGRNAEAVLGALNSIHNSLFIIHNSVMLSFASDGRDNTEAAGAIADFLTIEKIEKLKLNPQKFLENHDSFNFFEKTGDLIFTKPKTFNVSDLMIVLRT